METVVLFPKVEVLLVKDETLFLGAGVLLVETGLMYLKLEVPVKAEAWFVMAEVLFFEAAALLVEAGVLKAETLFVETAVLPV